jgi:membrane-associated phospholipid phosphatase
MDDGLLAVFDSKYHYNFWRPATAIRNGDIDGHDATARDAAWVSLIDAPLHPEYPSAHATLAGAVGAVLKAEAGKAPLPALATSSPTAKGATRQWTRVDDFVREVAESRVYAGIHYRFSIDAGAALGRSIGELAATRLLAID